MKERHAVKIRTATGQLYAPFPGRGVGQSEAILSASVSTIPLPTFYRGWAEFHVRFPEPITPTYVVAREYDYELLIRSARHQRFLLMAAHRRIVDKLVEQRGLEMSLARPVVDIDRIVGDMLENRGELSSRYSLGAMWAKVSGPGEAYRTIIVYGNDLLDSGLLRRQLDYMQPYRLHLRDIRLGIEVLAIGSRGECGFPAGASDPDAERESEPSDGAGSVERDYRTRLEAINAADDVLRVLQDYVDWASPRSI